MYQAAHGVSRTLFPTKNMVHGLAHLNLDITIFCRKLLEGDMKHSLETLKTAQLGFRQVAWKESWFSFCQIKANESYIVEEQGIPF